MDHLLIFPGGSTSACRYAAGFLADMGVATVDHPTPEITHLLLDAPSFAPDGTLRGGGDVIRLLERLPQSVTVIGGNLEHPELEGYRKLDLLRNARYLAKNAALTADCAIRVAVENLNSAFCDSPALIIGWGRIGKCLAQLLQGMGCPVSIAARKDGDLAMIEALGYRAVHMNQIPAILPRCRLLFNTAPEAVIPEALSDRCSQCIQIDLASKPGIIGKNVITARGLPGIRVPESSGKLMAQTIFNHIREESICK